MVNLGQSLVPRGINWTISEPLQKNKLKRSDQSQASPEGVGVLMQDAGKGQGGGRLPSWDWESMGGLNEPGRCFCSWCPLWPVAWREKSYPGRRGSEGEGTP